MQTAIKLPTKQSTNLQSQSKLHRNINATLQEINNNNPTSKLSKHTQIKSKTINQNKQQYAPTQSETIKNKSPTIQRTSKSNPKPKNTNPSTSNTKSKYTNNNNKPKTRKPAKLIQTKQTPKYPKQYPTNTNANTNNKAINSKY